MRWRRRRALPDALLKAERNIGIVGRLSNVERGRRLQEHWERKLRLCTERNAVVGVVSASRYRRAFAPMYLRQRRRPN